MRKRSSREARSFAAPSSRQRVALILELLAHLGSDDVALTPVEVLRAVRLVPGWSFTAKHQRGTQFEVDAPGSPSLALNRDALIALLVARWVDDALADLAGPRP